MDSSNDKKTMLEKLYAPYAQCTHCPLGKLGRTNVVFGEGNPNAKLMFIGEGPGKEEDQQARPFIGRSGKLLTRVLESLGILREQVYITNIVKCRPPQNRKPYPIESKTCKNLLLLNQIQIINPQAICTLGGTPLEGLLEKKVKISQAHGKAIVFNSTIIVPTYHPAYILRNKKELESFTKDIALAFSLTQ